MRSGVTCNPKMSTSSAADDKSAHRGTVVSEEPPQQVLYGTPQHETDVPADPYREMFGVNEDEPPEERTLFTLFKHFCVDVDEDDYPSTVGVGPMTAPRTA